VRGDEAIGHISQTTGTDSTAVNSVIQSALPMILGGLANNAATPDGAESLNSALEQHHDGSLLDNLGGFAPGAAHDILENALNGLTQSQGGAGVLFIVGIAGAIWSASAYIGAFIRASNAIWDSHNMSWLWRSAQRPEWSSAGSTELLRRARSRARS
jgi:uncharacterized BrkB/YihY/UPF0761 family membrane protein